MFYGERPSRETIVSDGEEIPLHDTVYDFRHAEEGDVVRVVTDSGVHEFKKIESSRITIGENHEPVVRTLGARAGWMYGGEHVEFTVLEPNDKGTSFLTHREVARAGDEIGVTFINREVHQAAIVYGLGRVAGMAELLAAEEKNDMIDA